MIITPNASFKNEIESVKSERKIMNYLQMKQWMNGEKLNGKQKQIQMHR
jgi:hypothetical protein